MKDTAEQPWTMSVMDAAKEYFGITSKDAAYRAVHDGIIPAMRIGRLLKVPREAAKKRSLDLAERGLKNP
jgi:excisionase family DNA binding protein